MLMRRDSSLATTFRGWASSEPTLELRERTLRLWLSGLQDENPGLHAWAGRVIQRFILSFRLDMMQGWTKISFATYYR
jgi:hypothetical protein